MTKEKKISKNKIKKSKPKIIKGLLYTKADIDYIRDNISTMKLTEIGVHLKRDFDSICHKVIKMGLADKRIYTFKAFKADDLAFLQENGENHTIEQLMEITGRSRDSIRIKLKRLNLKAINVNGYERLTEEQVDFIKKNYQNLTDKQLAEKLNKSVSGIGRKIKKLGLRISRPYNARQTEN
jgi:hypothetical protein